jgi:TPR repeat protein
MHRTLTTRNAHINTLLLALALWLPVQAFAEGAEGMTGIEALEEGQQAFNMGDYELSFSLWSSLATQGHADAQVFVGLSYDNGWGTPRNAQLATVWYQKAAKNNHATGQYLLGLRYIQGTDTERAEGLMWLQQAAANGDSSAQQFLEKGQTRGWFSGITASTVPTMLTTPPSAPSIPVAKSSESKTLALVD